MDGIKNNHNIHFLQTKSIYNILLIIVTSNNFATMVHAATTLPLTTVNVQKTCFTIYICISMVTICVGRPKRGFYCINHFSTKKTKFLINQDGVTFASCEI